jgi:hypothetical protein
MPADLRPAKLVTRAALAAALGTTVSRTAFPTSLADNAPLSPAFSTRLWTLIDTILLFRIWL